MAYETAEVKLLESMAKTLERIEKLLTPKIALTATAVHHESTIPFKGAYIHPRRVMAETESEAFHIDNPDHNS